MSTSSDRPAPGPLTATPSATQEIPTLPPPDQGPRDAAGARSPGATRTGLAGAGSTAVPAAAAAAPPTARPATGGHDLPPPRAAQRPAAPPAAPAAPAAPGSAPAVAPADAPGSLAAPGHAAHGPQPTGPVDFVPAPPGAPATTPAPAVEPVTATPTVGSSAAAPAPGTPTVESPAAAIPTAGGEPASWPESLRADDRPAGRPRRRAVRPADPQALAGLGLAVVAVALLEVGLLGAFGADPFWSTVTLWSAFATLCAVLALAAFVAFYPAGNRLRSSAVWRLAAAGLVGLSVFWVLVVLPVVASDRGFVLTAALGCLGAALWIGPRRST